MPGRNVYMLSQDQYMDSRLPVKINTSPGLYETYAGVKINSVNQFKN